MRGRAIQIDVYLLYLAAVTFPPLPQPKLVLDLATLKGSKAELTWLTSERGMHNLFFSYINGEMLLSRRELIWYYQDGANHIFPDAWEKFVQPIPVVSSMLLSVSNLSC